MRHARLLPLLAVCLAAGMLAGCNAWPATPLRPPLGVIYTQVRAPLDIDFQAAPADKTLKTGLSTCHYLWIPLQGALSFAWQDPPSIEKAAKQGKLAKVEYADYEVMSVLGIYTEFTIRAHGTVK